MPHGTPPVLSASPSQQPSALPAQAQAQPHRPSALSHFASGLSSGALAAFLLQPADLLKTRVQQAPPRASLLTTVRNILNGPAPIQTLWRGTVPSVIRTSVGSALYFATLASIRERLATDSQHAATQRSVSRGQHSSTLVQLSPTANLLSGAFARASVGFVVMPITILKVRFESDLYKYRNLYSASASILRTEGIAGFFRGWGATAVRDAPNAGLYLFFYEAGKKNLSFLFTDTQHTALSGTTATWINMVSSAFAGAAATAVTNPFDTLKTRLQVLPGEYTNMWTALRRILREEGARRLFDGLGLRMARKAVSSSLVWTGYEFFIGRNWRSSKEERLR
ncbi:mitochondrial carrier domain-containing protein [Kalaharituber pfeilii]|nr:mitochondrial carrier domain-containing protein [Kalaharituber pfeilii]